MPSDRVQAALDELKAALADEGMDPGTTEAQLRYILPPEPTVVGNYADLQRMGAAALTGTIPTPPGVDDVQTSDTNEAFTMPPDPVLREQIGNEGGAASLDTPPVPGQETATGTDTPGDLDSMSKAELEDEAERRGVKVTSSMTKAEITAALEGA